VLLLSDSILPTVPSRSQLRRLWNDCDRCGRLFLDEAPGRFKTQSSSMSCTKGLSSSNGHLCSLANTPTFDPQQQSAGFSTLAVAQQGQRTFANFCHKLIKWPSLLSGEEYNIDNDSIVYYGSSAVGPKDFLRQPRTNQMLPTNQFFTTISATNSSNGHICSLARKSLLSSPFLLLSNPPIIPSTAPNSSWESRSLRILQSLEIWYSGDSFLLL